MPISEAGTLSNITQLTDGFDRAGEAFFSNDMRWIVFRAVAVPGQPPRLYLGKLIAGDSGIAGIESPICITPAGTRSAHGCFSLDGLSLIFSSNADAASDAPGRHIGMRIFRADGWEGVVAMADKLTGVNLAQHPIDTIGDAQDCSFSPDQKWICFTAGDQGHGRLMVMHPDGTRQVPLTSSRDSDGQPAFSPDGKSLLYTSMQGASGNAQIYRADCVFNPDGQIIGLANARQLTHEDQVTNLNPAWHPDGRHIIYATSRHGRNNYELYLMDSAGLHKTRITFSPGADLLPVFSPDASYLMWTSRRSRDGTDEVFAARFRLPRGS